MGRFVLHAPYFPVSLQMCASWKCMWRIAILMTAAVGDVVP
jgi:hypothetical protein